MPRNGYIARRRSYAPSAHAGSSVHSSRSFTPDSSPMKTSLIAVYLCLTPATALMSRSLLHSARSRDPRLSSSAADTSGNDVKTLEVWERYNFAQDKAFWRDLRKSVYDGEVRSCGAACVCTPVAVSSRVRRCFELHRRGWQQMHARPFRVTRCCRSDTLGACVRMCCDRCPRRN